MSYTRFYTALIVVAGLAINFALCESETNYCYSDDKTPYFNTGTRTPYHFVHGVIENATVPNCEPMQIWMMCRHGTRYPSTKEVQMMSTKLPELRTAIIENHEKGGSGSLCEKDLANLKAWKLDPNICVRRAKYLSKQGEEDLQSLGTRYKDRLPELLQPEPTDVTAKKYLFRSTSTQRTVASMKNFMKGVFGNECAVEAEIVPNANDTLLTPYKICKSWLEEMNSTSTTEEVDAFINGTEFQQLLHDVSRRLGFRDSFNFDTVWLMYSMCAFEKAWRVDELSPWCAVFTKPELEIFEYEGDLYDYYHIGYGEKLSSKIGCPPLQDMFEHFLKLENKGSDEEPRGVFHFTHSASLQTFYTAMGIAKDSTPLKASNFRSMEDRQWRTSLLAPFATNFAAVFYKCDSSHKVRFYLAEKPLMYEGCEDGVCDWEYLKKKLGPVASKCNLEFCQN